MLLESEYIKLWDNNFPKLTEERMTLYEEYEKRVILFEKHLKSITSKCKKIKYILVAEAPATGDTYFYNCNHLYKTPYFSAICKAFDVRYEKPLTIESKNAALGILAEKGVVLIDLFPFSIPFTSSLRKKLMGKGITKKFWDGSVYSIKTQISALCPYLDSEWDLCLIAPPTLSCHIVGAYNAINITPCTNVVHNNNTFKVLTPTHKRGCDHKKVASDSSGNPNAELIRVAFNLPL